MTGAKLDPLPPRDELMRLWVEALRSGDYKQGQGTLRTTDDHYCCLGVLCEVAGLASEPTECGNFKYSFGDSFSSSNLPFVFGGYMGLSPIENGWLMRLNDDAGKPFSEIADCIEKNWMGPKDD